jgi:hypothetical protein
MSRHARTPIDEKGIVPAGTPTQIANPSRASWRTFVQALVSGVVVLNVAAPAAYEWLTGPEGSDIATQFLGEFYGPIVLGLNVVVVGTAFVSKLAAWLMAKPRVNEWVAKYLPFLTPIPLKDTGAQS